MKELIYKEETYQIRGTCYEVYKEKGCGFVEPVYLECMEFELSLQGIAFEAQPTLRLEYQGQPLKSE